MLAGTGRHLDAASSQNQSLTRIAVWQHLALAGIGKQLLEFFNGIIHGIAALNSSAVIQYHAMCFEPFMVSVITPNVLSVFIPAVHSRSLDALDQVIGSISK